MRSSRASSLFLLGVLLAALSVAAQNANQSPSNPSSDESAHLPVCDINHPDFTETLTSKCNADLKEYNRIVRQKVQRGWVSLITNDARMKRACAVVDFTIRPDGGISSLKIPRSTGDLQLDRATLGGFVWAAPFPPPPPGCDHGLKYRMRIYYNPGGRAISQHPPNADRTTAPDNEQIMRDKDIVPPALIYSPNSEHPPVLLNTLDPVPEEVAKGRVLLKAVVTSSGDVASVEILHGAGNGFDEKAMALVVMSKFKPATIAGIPVRTEVTFRVDLP